MPKAFARRHEYHRKYEELNTRFEKNRQTLYEHQKALLEKQLQDVVDERDDELLETFKDLEEARDNDLLRLHTWKSILLGRTQLQHDRDIEQIDREYAHVAGVVESKMIQRLESHVKRFKEDKSLVDVSSDATLELTAGLAGSSDTTAAFFAKSGSGQGPGRRQVKLRRRENNNNNNNNTRGGSGSESGIGSEAWSGRRANDKDLSAFLSDVDLNAYSSSEAISASAAAAAESAAGTAPLRITNARNTKATKALTSLKADEISQDLALLRKKR